jgi:kynureninase
MSGLDRASALALDDADRLAAFRDRFVIADDLVYLDGNSLGRLPKAALQRVSDEVAHGWGVRLIRGWGEGWMDLPVTVGDKLADAALGAAAGQTVLADSTTVCFYKLCCAALDLRSGRNEIVTDIDNFPTDRYVLEGLAQARGLKIVWLRCDRDGGPTAPEVAAVVGSRTALVTFSHVSYLSAHIAEMAAINAPIHDAGALALWDLSHSVGSVPLALDEAGADLAVGCTYKYLNGGPGAPAFMYVREELQQELRQPIWGWIGRRDRFDMDQGHIPAAGPVSLLSGTPPVLALSCVDEGVSLVAEAGIERIREKGIALTSYAISLADDRLASLGVEIGSPREDARRGAHVALLHADAQQLCTGLRERGVIPDFRQPNVIRLGLSPLTTRFSDVWDGVESLRSLLAKQP